jgi:MFS superfamily sulfate permease-like transporter
MAQNKNQADLATRQTPKEGFAGLFENWKPDALSGFLVSLIALPLSLGIAGASGFPPIMGVLTAIIGGLVVAFFAGSALTIKGPAAGLIVIVVGAVEALGQGDAVLGWKLTLGIVVLAGVLQIIFGLLRVASLANFFPLSAVHGMLAAIGIIIMSKQLHLALGVEPTHLKGKEPIELLEMLPQSFGEMNMSIAIIGFTSLLILFSWSRLKHKFFKLVPAPLVVLVVGIALGLFFNLSDPSFEPLKPLVNPGEFSVAINVSFDGMTGAQSSAFWQYLFLFTIIGSLESLLTVKAIDLLDPWKRKARMNRDLIGLGIGNIVAGFLGGLPMISEVARSSANINNGGRTQWANFFHSISLLVFVVLLVPVIKMVPIASLAAMLIFVGFRLASPNMFIHAYKTGKEQFLVFVVTIIVTLFTDLLIGIFAGIVLELLINLFFGQKISALFTAPVRVEKLDNKFIFVIEGACSFSNWISFERKIANLEKGAHIVIDASKATLLDHTFMENIGHVKDELEGDGGSLELIGIANMSRMSADKTSACLQIQKSA